MPLQSGREFHDRTSENVGHDKVKLRIVTQGIRCAKVQRVGHAVEQGVLATGHHGFGIKVHPGG